jgi:ribosome-binding factor A
MSSRHQPSGQRQLRVGEELRHALAWIIERGELHDPALSRTSVTVTEVRISPDLRQATVFIMPLGGSAQASVLAALTRARGFLRRRIARTVELKYVPDLAFRLDHSFEEADRIGRALRRPEVARDLDSVPESPPESDEEGHLG